MAQTLTTPQMVLRHAITKPRAVALTEYPGGRERTFGELAARCDQLARALLQAGLEKGDRVAVLSKNSIEHMEVYIACGLAGLVTQPLNWRLAAAELERILIDAAPAALIASDEYAETAAPLSELIEQKRFYVFSPTDSGSSYEWLVNSGASAPPRTSDIGGDDPYFILYTGGSSGRSKGVLHSHATALAGMLNNTAVERIIPTDKYLLMSPMFHSPVMLAMNYLTHGCPVVLMTFEAQLALAAIESTRATAFIGMRTMLQSMANVIQEGAHFDLSSIRNIQYGGSPMGTSFVPTLFNTFPGDFMQCFGTTEEMGITFLGQDEHRAAAKTGDYSLLQSCGKAAYLSEVKLVDAAGVTTPADGKTAGEIAVRSQANMLGYWKMPAETAEITLPGGWLRTGDLATCDKDGYYYIVGRSKDMIISGGENIYALQVEQALSRHPAVSEVAVIGVPDAQWGESVRAFIVLANGHQATEEELIAVAASELASYQKPRSIVFLEELPREVTGKVSKQILKSLETAPSNRAES